MQTHDPFHHLQLLNNTHSTHTLYHRQYMMFLKRIGNLLVLWGVKPIRLLVCLGSHYRHEHVFTRLICLFVKQMVLMCLRGRLLLLLRWHNIPIKTISRSCAPNEPSKLILKVATRQWFGLCVYLFGLHKYVTIANYFWHNCYKVSYEIG